MPKKILIVDDDPSIQWVLGRSLDELNFAVTAALTAARARRLLEPPTARLYPELSLELQAFRAGDCAILAHAAETFNEVGQVIKEGSPIPHTVFTGYTNGCIGYIPTAQAHVEGGYEVEEAPVAYRMSGLFDPGCAEEVTRRSVALLQRVWD